MVVTVQTVVISAECLWRGGARYTVSRQFAGGLGLTASRSVGRMDTYGRKDVTSTRRTLHSSGWRIEMRSRLLGTET